MSVEQARRQLDNAIVFGVQGLCDVCWNGGWCQYAMWRQLRVEAASIALDLAVSIEHQSSPDQRQQVMWQDRLHRTLLAEVAF